MKNKPMKNKLPPIPEILGSFLSARAADSADGLKADAGNYIATNYGADLSAFDIAVVENTEAQVHISLPYYSGLEEANAIAAADAELDDVAGGEVGLSLFIVGAAAGVLIMGGVFLGFDLSDAYDDFPQEKLLDPDSDIGKSVYEK